MNTYKVKIWNSNKKVYYYRTITALNIVDAEQIASHIFIDSGLFIMSIKQNDDIEKPIRIILMAIIISIIFMIAYAILN